MAWERGWIGNRKRSPAPAAERESGRRRSNSDQHRGNADGLFQKTGQGLDERRLVDRTTMADDLHLERAHDISDESDAIDVAAVRRQRRRDREEGIAGAYRVDHLAGEGRNAVHRPPA